MFAQCRLNERQQQRHEGYRFACSSRVCPSSCFGQFFSRAPAFSLQDGGKEIRCREERESQANLADIALAEKAEEGEKRGRRRRENIRSAPQVQLRVPPPRPSKTKRQTKHDESGEQMTGKADPSTPTAVVPVAAIPGEAIKDQVKASSGKGSGGKCPSEATKAPIISKASRWRGQWWQRSQRGGEGAALGVRTSSGTVSSRCITRPPRPSRTMRKGRMKQLLKQQGTINSVFPLLTAVVLLPCTTLQSTTIFSTNLPISAYYYA